MDQPEDDFHWTDDDDDVLYRIREQRMKELKKQLSDKQEHGDGLYSVIGNERELMSLAAHTPRLVIHFFSPTFKRCTHMSENMAELAKRQRRCRFVGIEAANAPFMAVQMSIRVLPCVVAVVDGEAVDRLVGFEGLGGDGNSFEVDALARWLVKSKVLS